MVLKCIKRTLVQYDVEEEDKSVVQLGFGWQKLVKQQKSIWRPVKLFKYSYLDLYRLKSLIEWYFSRLAIDKRCMLPILLMFKKIVSKKSITFLIYHKVAVHACTYLPLYICISKLFRISSVSLTWVTSWLYCKRYSNICYKRYNV